jgi:hypothetical protein
MLAHNPFAIRCYLYKNIRKFEHKKLISFHMNSALNNVNFSKNLFPNNFSSHLVDKVCATFIFSFLFGLVRLFFFTPKIFPF